jgi:hypothetical protein
MTPKEKAIELVDIYKDITTTWIFKDTITANVINYDLAKNCALIAVDEVLKILEHSIPEKHTIYWQEVQKEIEKL